MRHAKEEPASSSNDRIMDLYSIVEEISGLPSKEITKLLKDSENFTILCNTARGSLRQVDVERLASSLPLHLVAMFFSVDFETGLAHLLHGVRLLHTLADTASRHTRLDQIMFDDVKFSEQLIDLVFFILLVLAQTDQDYGSRASLSALHLALVASTLHLLTAYISSQWHELVHVLLAHPKVDTFMDVAFDVVHTDIRLLQIRLAALSNDILCKSSSFAPAERTASFLCQQCEVSLQFLLCLCQQKMFRDQLLKNKELCKNGGILLLSCTILKLKVSDSFKDSFGVVAAISRLKAKVLSILLQLYEADSSISYLDEVACSSKCMHLAKAVVMEILDLVKAAFRKDAKQVGFFTDRSNPTGLVLLNSLHLADIYSDDSNFRTFFMANAIEVLIEILAIPCEEFQSSWCSADMPIMEEDSNIDYDPFAAAGTALIFITPDHENAQAVPVSLSETSFSSNSSFNGMLTVTYAQQRTSYLVKVIANLHLFVPNIFGEEERNLFLNQFHECLRMDTSEAFRYSSNSKAQKTATICENLSTLSDHAPSLIPNFLNQEDVLLLRAFIEQLKKLITPQISDNIKQEPFPRDVQGATRKVEDLSDTIKQEPFSRDVQGSTRKVEDLSSMHQTSLNWNFTKESGPRDFEKLEGQSEERLPMKRKRNIMSGEQINLIEKALVDEPEMQRNSALLQSWTDLFRLQGSDITSSQLKNWLNNRKAKLARAAREAQPPSEGNNTCPDKSCAPSTSQFYDSPDSTGDEPYTISSSLVTQSVPKSTKSERRDC